MDAYTFAREFFLECDELPPVEQIVQSTACTTTKAHDVRRQLAREYDLRDGVRDWAAARDWLAELRKRRENGTRTDIKTKTVATTIGRTHKTAEAAVRIVAKLERLQEAVRAQRGVA